jgi:hypothetical protein
MPSHSEKQAKTMSAIAHGWKPKGSAKGIPLKVAEEFHAADKGKKYGKGHHQRATGGALNLAYAIRRAEGGQVFQGPILSTVPGRTDKHEMEVADGSYVIPSEAVSHLGENNTLAGVAKLKQLGPHGIRRMVHAAHGASAIKGKHKSKGGAVHHERGTGRPVPVVTAGGEHVLSPHEVNFIGDGDTELGHRLLDNWVMQNRKKHISTLKALKPPAKD